MSGTAGRTIRPGNHYLIEMDLFPYEFRGDQESMVRLIRETVASGGSAVIESGTGTGKTVVSLTGALEAVLGTGKKVIYLTRTKSQQRQVISEARRISEKAPVLCVGLQGRSGSTCPMMMSDPDLAYGTPEELSKLCSEYKRQADGKETCRFFDNIDKTNIQVAIDYLLNEHPEPEQFAEYCKARDLCPYELVKYALPHADVIAAPYPFVFMPHIMDHLLQWMAVPFSGVVVIVDEAHNLPDYLRDVMTAEYSSFALDLAEKEAVEWGNRNVYQGLSATDVISVFRECMDKAGSEYLHVDDGLVPSTYLQDELMERLGVSSLSLSAIYKGLVDMGETIAGIKKSKHKLPRTYIGSFGRFLQEWTACDEETHVFLIIGGENPKLQSYCLDPYEPAEPLRRCWASVHMSGTLEPLADYSHELGMEDGTECIFPSPFPKENLKVVYVDDVSTKFDEITNVPETYQKLKGYVVDLVGAVRRNTAVFFASYSMMDRFIADMVPEILDREVFYERRGMLQSELMDVVSSFRSSEGSVLFAVTGGRISEGLDFPDKDLELAIIVGIPYAKPTAKQEALRRYFEVRFGDGWEHSVKIPAMRKMRQAIGRLIRSETDRGVAVILDRRVSTMDDIGAELTDDPCKVVREFFSGQI
jgi:DNA excision repair protein ERCC-2